MRYVKCLVENRIQAFFNYPGLNFLVVDIPYFYVAIGKTIIIRSDDVSSLEDK